MDINDLQEKAKDLTGKVPDDSKEKVSDVVSEGIEKLAPENLKDEAKHLFDGLKDKVGL